MKQYKAILRKNRGWVLLAALLNILTSLSMVFAGYSLSFLFTAYEYDGNKVRAITITFVIELVIWLAAMGIYFLTCLAQAKIQQRIKNDLRAMIGGTISALNHEEFTAKDCGNYVSWLTNDVEQIYNQSFSALFSGIENLATTVFSLGALLLLGWQIGVAAILLLAVISVLPQLTNKHLQKANAAQSEALEIGTEQYKDVIMGGSIFFLSNLRDQITSRILRASQAAEQVCFHYRRTNAAVRCLISTVSLIGQVVLLFVTLLAVAAGAAPTGAVLSVGNLAGGFFNGAGELVQAVMTVRASKPLWEKFQTKEKPGAGTEVGEIPAITMENVSFSYGERTVLENKSCTFRRGGKYAVMGESGCGKTTLVKILLGLLPSYTGRVCYGGLEQREVSLESLYRQVAYVDQQVYLFQDTVRFNLTLGQPYSEEALLAVVKKCRLEDYIGGLPHGLDTVILENGKNLSGGQRQRIALARALLRNVRYLILDEGTSALDEANARRIETDLLQDPELTVLLVTHHLHNDVKAMLTDIYPLAAVS